MKIRRRSIRRVLALLATNLLLGGLALAIAHDYANEREAARDRLSRQMRVLTSERALGEEEQAYLEANLAAYQAVVRAGLLDPPDRLAVAALLEDLQKAHGLNAIRYSVSPQLERPLGPGGGMSVLSTSVTIDMSGIADTDMLDFVQSVETAFPGDIRVTALRLNRLETVDGALLARLQAGEPIDLVEGHLAFEWRTLHWRDRGDGQGRS
jgi:hypothetical protein